MKPRKKTIRIWLSVGMLFLSLGASGQVFTGKVVDDQAVPIGYATVALYHKTDFSVVQGGITEEDGCFSLKVADSGTYTVQISFVGFQTCTLESSPCDLGTIVLKPNALELGEAIVTGYRPKYKAVAGGLSTQVENSVLGKAGTAKDVIGHLAGVRKKSTARSRLSAKASPSSISTTGWCATHRNSKGSGRMLSRIYSSLPIRDRNTMLLSERY